ncbi:hypothetical protein PanWU01x14_303660 [Parasponia andersonii]|uniref:Uncharacterized protein n=1 Tax=Parasponia andersonii TaxID=3476 RepID=A0A2P5ASR4_PARAD|nr:hypothetical protein PanWU01x14_303660 [Parasponia andersonii]
MEPANHDASTHIRDTNTTCKPQHRVLNSDCDATTPGKTTTQSLQPKFAMPPSTMLTPPDDLDLCFRRIVSFFYI